jgi:cell division transport system permease protein
MRRTILRALRDIFANRFLSMITIITIALAVVIVGAFGLFLLNAGDLLNAWQKGIRLMVYLKLDTNQADRLDTESRLHGMAGVQALRFISKSEAMQILRQQMQRQASLLDNLRENPLPDAYEITLLPSALAEKDVEFLARQIETLGTVENVEYGQKWFRHFSNVLDLFRLAGYALGAVLLLAVVLIVANTIRLVLYARHAEIEIMRLVGASDGFIKGPFYILGLLQGGCGSLVGIGLLYLAYLSFGSHVQQSFTAGFVSLRFFPPQILGSIAGCGMAVGWLGSCVSLRQFLKT